MISSIKIFIAVIVSAVLASVLVSGAAFAVDPLTICHPSNTSSGSYSVGSNAGSSDVCNQAAQPTTKNPIVGTIKIVIELLSTIIGVLSVVMIMIAGLRMILSNGDSQTIAHSRDAILYAMIGIFVAVFAEGLVLFVVDKIK
jgi:hypothetical protein